jgi:hypothetical protein
MRMAGSGYGGGGILASGRMAGSDCGGVLVMGRMASSVCGGVLVMGRMAGSVCGGVLVNGRMAGSGILSRRRPRPGMHDGPCHGVLLPPAGVFLLARLPLM